MLILSLKRLPPHFVIEIPRGDQAFDRLLGALENELCRRGYLVDRGRLERDSETIRATFRRVLPPREG